MSSRNVMKKAFILNIINNNYIFLDNFCKFPQLEPVCTPGVKLTPAKMHYDFGNSMGDENKQNSTRLQLSTYRNESVLISFAFSESLSNC